MFAQIYHGYRNIRHFNTLMLHFDMNCQLDETQDTYIKMDINISRNACSGCIAPYLKKVVGLQLYQMLKMLTVLHECALKR